MTEPDVRKGMPPVKLSREEFEKRYRSRFVDPAFAAAAARTRRHRRRGVGRLQPFAQGAADAQGWAGLRRSRIRDRRRLARCARRHPGGAAPPRRCGRDAAHSDHQRLVAQRAYLPRRDVEDLAAGRARRAGLRGDGICGRHPRSVAAGVGIRPANPSLQVLRLDRDAALPLAVQLLSELFARPDRRLDERDLSALGRGARHPDRHAGELVSRPDRAEADDRPAGLRRRRQSRSDVDPRQERRRGQGAGAERLALSAAPGRPAFWAGRAWRQRRARRTCAARSPTG